VPERPMTEPEAIVWVIGRSGTPDAPFGCY